MALVEWNEQFTLGIASVDHEHREMIDLINRLHRELSSTGGDAESVLFFFGEIFAKISSHFALEEKEMKVRNYPKYDDHKEDHEDLLDGIRDIMDGYEQGLYTEFEEKLQDHLSNWFSVHFRTKDAALHQFLSH